MSIFKAGRMFKAAVEVHFLRAEVGIKTWWTMKVPEGQAAEDQAAAEEQGEEAVNV
jgi:hypothetical protein